MRDLCTPGSQGKQGLSVGKRRQASAHLDPIPLIPPVLCRVATNILIYVMEGNADVQKNPLRTTSSSDLG